MMVPVDLTAPSPNGLPVMISYTNWRGETRDRRILPGALMWGMNEWHRVPQWLMWARDLEDGQMKTFAMKDIHEWKDGQ